MFELPLKPARCYTHQQKPPYTRKEYIHGIPPPKITKFVMGNTKLNPEVRLVLKALEGGVIRHNALEAARVAANRLLMDKLSNNYFMQVYPYPHVVLRENKMIFGAHADRLQDGMRRAFGKPIGTAARVSPNQSIITIRVNGEGVEVAKEALRRASAKLPIPCRIVIEKIVKAQAEG